MAVALAGVAVQVSRIDQSLRVLPSPEDIAAALWTGVIAAIAGAYLVNASRRAPAPQPDELMARSRRTVPPELWMLAETSATENGTDPSLVQSILLTENLQRPPWFRRLEFLKAKLGFAGTYGVMQVGSTSHVSDADSVRLACEGHLKNLQPRFSEYGGADPESLNELIRLHNEDPAFIEMVRNFYYRLHEQRNR
jgi:hypothetical protein